MMCLFDKELKRLEQELLDLKTGHKRGAGLTRFYTADLTISLGAWEFAKFQASVLDGEPVPAFISIYVGGEYGVDFISGSDAGDDWRQIWFSPLDNPKTFLIRAVSTSKIKLEQIPV